MRKVIYAFMFAAFLLSLDATQARAQSDELKFEAGAHATMLRLDSRSAFFFPANVLIVCVRAPCVPSAIGTPERTTEAGFGGRFGYNLHRHVAVEAELNFFPRDRATEGGRKTQGLFGVKAGRRFEKFGLFAKARPGFLRLSRGDFRPRENTACIATTVFPPPAACFDSEPRTHFALDVGGVLEFYPSRRVVVRLDAGDTIVRIRNATAGVIGGPAATSDITHNFQFSVGFGYRF